MPPKQRLAKTQYNRSIATDALGAIENNSNWKNINTGYRNGNFYPINIGGVNVVGYGTTLGNNPLTKKKLTERGKGNPMKGWLTKQEALNTANYDLKEAYEKIRKNAIEYDSRADTISFNALLPLSMSKYQEGNVGNIYKPYIDAAIKGNTKEMKRLVGTTPHADDNRRQYMNTVDIYRGIWPQRKFKNGGKISLETIR